MCQNEMIDNSNGWFLCYSQTKNKYIWNCVIHFRLLGYLQQEGLTATSRAFIYESPNLKEYAEHSSEDGVIPAFVFVCVKFMIDNTVVIINQLLACVRKTCLLDNNFVIIVLLQSLFGKNLITILNEYVAVKAKGECP